MNAKRVLAVIGIILILAMYACTMIFALMDSPAAKGLLMGSIFCTVVVPVILHFVIRSADAYKKRQDAAKREHEEQRAKLQEMMAAEDGENSTETPEE